MATVINRRFLTRLHAQKRNHIDFTYWMIRTMDSSGLVTATPGEMAEALNLTEGAVIQALETLERQGLVATVSQGYQISSPNAIAV